MRAALATIVGVAVAVRWLVAWHLPLQSDEASSLCERSFRFLMSDHERFFNPVPWRALTVLLSDTTDSLLHLRMPSTLLAALGCGVVAWGAARRAGPWAGWIAGLGVACTPWLARQQGLFRGYGLAMFAAACVAVALMHLLHRPTIKRAVVAALTVGLAAWAHFSLLCWAPVLIALLCWLKLAGRLKTAAMLGACALLVMICAHPTWLAWHGLMLKAGTASESMMRWSDYDPLWQPEVPLVLIGIALVLFARGERSTVMLMAIAATLALAWIASAKSVATVRWGHLVTVAPALWLSVAINAAATAGDWPKRLAFIVAIYAVAAVTVLSASLRQAATRQDDLTLAQHIRASKLVAVRALEQRHRPTDSAGAPAGDAVLLQGSNELRARATGIAHALGYYDGGPSRCVGADVVHQMRCRKRSRKWGTELAVCIDGNCVLPFPNPATPIPGAELHRQPVHAILFGQCLPSRDMVCEQVGRWVVTRPASAPKRKQQR